MAMIKRFIETFYCCMWLCGISCGLAAQAGAVSVGSSAPAPAQNEPVASAHPAASVVVSTLPLSAEQLFPASLGRDPFVAVPRSPAVAAASAHPAAGKDKNLPFNIHSLGLSGIISFGALNQAVLYDPASGAPYYLIKGQIFDRKNKLVPGVSGEIAGRQVKLTGKDKTVVHLSMPQDQ